MKMIFKFVFASATILATSTLLGGCATDKAFQEAMAKKEEKEAATGSNIMRKDRGSDVIVVSPDAIADKRNNPTPPRAGS